MPNFQLPIANSYSRRSQSAIGNRQPEMASLGLFVTRVLTATATEFAELQSIRGRLLVFGGNVVSTLTLVTLEHNVVAWHN
jgi:hypothetical protein